MTTATITAEEYKASLPKTPNKRGVIWTIESFSEYVSLRFPGVSVDKGQEWVGTTTKMNFTCSKHGSFSTPAWRFTHATAGRCCKKCQYDSLRGFGKRTRRKATEEIKERARQLRAEGLSYNKIAEILGWSHSSVAGWIDSVQRQKMNKRSADWCEANPEAVKAATHHYWCETPRGKAKRSDLNSGEDFSELTQIIIFFLT